MARRPSPSHQQRVRHLNASTARLPEIQRTREAITSQIRTFVQAADILFNRHELTAHSEEPRMFAKTAAPERTDRFVNSHPSPAWYYSRPGLELRSMLCCGVKELHGIQSHHTLQHRDGRQSATPPVLPWEIVQYMKEQYLSTLARRARPFVIFTDNHLSYANGAKFAGQALLEYIVEHRLGKVFRTGLGYNANSGNDIEMFTWAVEWPRLLEFNPVPQETANEQARPA